MDAEETIVDYITGKKKENVGSENNRQLVERFLVEQKGYEKREIEVDAEIALQVDGEPYRSRVDLVVKPGEEREFMVIKCVAGSIGSWEREIVSAARLLSSEYQVPYAVVSDGKDAVVLDTRTKKRVAKGLDGIFSRRKAMDVIGSTIYEPLPEDKIAMEKRVFKSYDSMKVNVSVKNFEK